MVVLAEIYFDKNMVPETPFEPDPESYNPEEPKKIPLEDVSIRMNRLTAWTAWNILYFICKAITWHRKLYALTWPLVRLTQLRIVEERLTSADDDILKQMFCWFS